MILAIRRRSAGAASAVVFCITLIAAAPAAGAQAHNDLWRIETSDDGTVVANLAMDHPRASGTVIITVMNIGFGPKDGCQPEVGVAVLKGSGYGNSVGKVSPAQTEPMSLWVDGELIPTPAPFLVKYDNGLEAVFSAGQRVVRALTAGTTASVQIVPGTPRLVFPLAGAGRASSQALNECIAPR
jgi:hypothetical protein